MLIFVCLLVGAAMAGCQRELSNSGEKILISYQRSGGIAGLVDDLSIDNNGHCILQRKNLKQEFDLTPGNLEQLGQAFEKADFFTLNREYLPDNIGADRIEYIVTYRTTDKEHTVRAMDGTFPDALAPVLSLLDQIVSENSK